MSRRKVKMTIEIDESEALANIIEKNGLYMEDAGTTSAGIRLSDDDGIFTPCAAPKTSDMHDFYLENYLSMDDQDLLFSCEMKIGLERIAEAFEERANQIRQDLSELYGPKKKKD